MKLFIKNMVSTRCIMIVKSVAESLSIDYSSVDLGEMDLDYDISAQQLDLLKSGLLRYGLDLLEDKKSVLVEKIKTVVIEMIHYDDETPKTKISDYISSRLNYDYTYLANLFSTVMTTTLQHFIISHKVERVKELLLYDELSLKEIAYKMNYSSVGHLANQFKKHTGMTTGEFKRTVSKRFMPYENVGAA